MYAAIVYERWCIDENYATLVTEVFTKISWLLRPAIAWFIRRTLRNGMRRHSVEEVMLQREAVEALDARLDGRVVSRSQTTIFKNVDDSRSTSIVTGGYNFMRMKIPQGWI